MRISIRLTASHKFLSRKVNSTKERPEFVQGDELRGVFGSKGKRRTSGIVCGTKDLNGGSVTPNPSNVLDFSSAGGILSSTSQHETMAKLSNHLTHTRENKVKVVAFVLVHYNLFLKMPSFSEGRNKTLMERAQKAVRSLKTKRKDMKEVVRLLSHNGTLITVQYLTGFNISGFTAGHPPALALGRRWILSLKIFLAQQQSIEPQWTYRQIIQPMSDFLLSGED